MYAYKYFEDLRRTHILTGRSVYFGPAARSVVYFVWGTKPSAKQVYLVFIFLLYFFFSR